MKVSLSWLKEYVPMFMAVPDLADALTMAGLEVEAVEDRYAYLETVVVGRVVEVLPHPNADRLKLCRVDGGTASGAGGLRCPQRGRRDERPVGPSGHPVAQRHGAGKDGHPRRSLRGMLCSEVELELGPDGSGLMVLDAALQPGISLKRPSAFPTTPLKSG
jgi:phenylalanyl-tRNA synthetase beta chain